MTENNINRKYYHSFLKTLFSHNHDYSHMTQMVKKLPAMQETWVRSLSQEDPLEKGKATHSGFLAWRIPWTEKAGGL